MDDLSSPTHIILNNISLATSGSYKCEVSGGPPRFQTDESVTELQVVGKSVSQPVSQPVSQSASQSASQPAASQSASQSVSQCGVR